MFRRLLSYCAAVILIGSLAGCSQGMFAPKGHIAAAEQHLFIISVLLMLIVVIPVFVMTMAFARRYRASNAKAKYLPNWAHNSWFEILCWGVPLIIIVILAVMTWTSSHRLSPYKSLVHAKKGITIQVVALDWKWLFIYPNQDVASVNQVVFPIDTAVNFKITAAAPMNSFFIPQLAGQIYAMTGMQTQLHLITQHPGQYYGFSANYSGNGFATMHFLAHAVSKKAFSQWIHQVQHSAPALTAKRYQQLAKPSMNVAAMRFTHVEPQLFKRIMLHYVKPNQVVGPGKPQAL